MADQPLAFVLMPFEKGFDDIYRLGIKQPAEAMGIRAERVDEQLYHEGILDRIYNQIVAADVIIADMSRRNSNVFYEVGYAHAKGKICILLTADADDIPFDLKHRRHVVYGDSILRLQTEIVKELEWAKREVENIRDKRIQVFLKECNGILEKSKYDATGKVSLKIDLSNNSDLSSSEIEMAYLYTGQGWTYHQDGKECPSTASDIPGFPVRHFISVPARRMRPKSWAQIRLERSRVLASTLRGEILRDEYRMSGRIVLRLVTSDGDADYDYQLMLQLRSSHSNAS